MNVRANGSYTIPWVDILAGVVFQSRPGANRVANPQVPFQAAVWEPSSASRTGTQFNGTSLTTGVATQQIDLLDFGDLYGERFNFGVDVYNLFNSDTATAWNNNYTAFFVDGAWVTDNPLTPAVEVNNWGTITQILNPRFMRLSMSVEF
jgi:hypothetical protein